MSPSRTITTKLVGILGAAVAASVWPTVPAPADHTDPAVSDVRQMRADLAQARSGTARFHNSSKATTAGYGPFPEGTKLAACISAPANDPHGGAMGFHWVNGTKVDTTLDPAEPEVLVYEPQRNGKLRLVAAEYVVFEAAWRAEQGTDADDPVDPPRLFGRALRYVDPETAERVYGLSAFYEIHAWMWKHNPAGMFANHNPRASCAHADTH